MTVKSVRLLDESCLVFFPSRWLARSLATSHSFDNGDDIISLLSGQVSGYGSQT